jgi:hypothetical protein
MLRISFEARIGETALFMVMMMMMMMMMKCSQYSSSRTRLSAFLKWHSQKMFGIVNA